MNPSGSQPLFWNGSPFTFFSLLIQARVYCFLRGRTDPLVNRALVSSIALAGWLGKSRPGLSRISLSILRRKESSFNLGSAETKLLYTLHWILLDAADECILESEAAGTLDKGPFAYLFPISAITVDIDFYAA